jgi:putative addiction module CopG family antidote
MPKINVTLTDELDQFIKTSLEKGRYEDTDQLVQSALRLLECQEQEDDVKLDILRAAIREGEESGIFEGDPFEYVRSMRKKRSDQNG